MTHRELSRTFGIALTLAALLTAGCSSEENGSSDPTTTSPDDSGGESSSTTVAATSGASMGGEVRGLPGLSEYADLPLDELLQTAFDFPSDVPVPDLELDRAYTAAEAMAGGSGTISYGADYVAEGMTVDEAFDAVDAAVDAEVWTADGEVEESSEGYFSLTYESDSAEVERVTFVFQEDAEELVATATTPVGVTEANPPEALWPWAGDVPQPPDATMYAWTVQIPGTGGGPELYLDMRWTSEPGTYDAIAAFISALPTDPLSPGEVTTGTDPFTEPEAAVTAEGGFDGQFSVSMSDPESDPTTILSGVVDLES